MSSPHTPPEPQRPAGVSLLAAVGRSLAAPVVQWFQILGYLTYRIRTALAGRALGRQCRTLARAMVQSGVGDQMLRDRVTAHENAARAAESIPEKRKAAIRELDKALALLGESGMSASVPVMEVEKEYGAAVGARDRAEALGQRAALTAGRILPPTFRGWAELLAGYAATAGAAYLAWLVLGQR